MEVELLADVMHIVSQVKGYLAHDRDGLEVLKSIFPAGTLKVRTIEIIEELELTRWGLYAGAVIYLSFGSNLDFYITICRFYIHESRIYLQVGAGIVADSDPATESQEAVNKAMALMRTLERLTEGLV